MQMLCPKCQNLMQQYERNGIHVDQCVECRGLFLDRGELEHLMQAEATYYSAGPGAAPFEPPPLPQSPRPAGAAPHYDDRYGGYPPASAGRFGGRYSRGGRYAGRGGGRYAHGRRRRRGFLEDLLDFG